MLFIADEFSLSLEDFLDSVKRFLSIKAVDKGEKCFLLTPRFSDNQVLIQEQFTQVFTLTATTKKCLSKTALLSCSLPILV